MLELASCMKRGVCNERGGGWTDELVVIAAQEKQKEGTKAHMKDEEKREKRKHIKKTTQVSQVGEAPTAFKLTTLGPETVQVAR